LERVDFGLEGFHRGGKLVTRAASSAVVGSAISEEMDGAGGAAAVDGLAEEEAEEECLDVDTRLSRALVHKTGGPRLRSS